MSGMKCRFRGAGGLGEAQRPPQQHTRSKGEQLVLACLLPCLLASFLVWLRLCKANKRKSKSKKEKGEQLRKRKKERKKDEGPEDQGTSGPVDQRTAGDQRTRGPGDGPEDRPPTRLGIPKRFHRTTKTFFFGSIILFIPMPRRGRCANQQQRPRGRLGLP